MGRAWIVAVAVVVTAMPLGIYAGVIAQRPKGTDVEQLQRMVEAGVAAIYQGGDPAPIQHYISNDYRDGEFTAPTLKREIASYVRRHSRQFSNYLQIGRAHV